MEIKRVTIRKNERGLLLRNGDFERILAPGSHILFAATDKLAVEKFTIDQPAFTHASPSASTRSRCSAASTRC